MIFLEALAGLLFFIGLAALAIPILSEIIWHLIQRKRGR